MNARTASRANRTGYSKQNSNHHKENAERRLTPRRDPCPSPLHQGAHHPGEQREGAHPVEGEQAVPRIEHPQEQRQEEACPGKLSEEAHLVQTTEIPLPAGRELPTAQRTTTTTTDHRRSIIHRTAHPQKEGEQTSTQPVPPASRWNKKGTRIIVNH